MSPPYPDLRPAPKNAVEPSASSSSSSPVPKPRPTAIACGQCRKAKSRTCVYAGATDETRAAALKRTAKDYQEKNAELEELYHHLRSRPEPEAIEILRRLRTSADVASTLRFVKDGDLMIQQFPRPNVAYDVNAEHSRSPLQVELAMRYPNVYLLNLPTWMDKGKQKSPATSSDDQAMSADARSRIGTEEMILSKMEQLSHLHQPLTTDFTRYPDERLFKATCEPWTSIINDDHLFRTLISVYLTWIHPAFILFDKDCFLDDLISHQTRFCSSMLVNVILSVSYFHYVLLITPRGTRADTSLGFAFLTEARRLWQRQEGSQTLTMLQAIILIAFTYNCVGRDKLGYRTYGYALAMATDMGLTGVTEARNGDQVLLFVEQTTIWGLFYLLNLTCFGLRKRALFLIPPAGPLPSEIRTASSEDALDTWTPYPYAQFFRPIYMQDLFNTNVGFWKLGKEVIARVDIDSHDSESRPTLTENEESYSRLLAWSQSIPSSLRLQELSPPFVLILHSWFHIVVIELFRPFTEQGSARSQSSPKSNSRVDAISAESVRQLKILIVTMAVRYDCRLVPLSLLQFSLTLCFETKKDLHNQESARVFAISFNILYDYSHSLPYFDFMLRLLKESVNKAYKDLPPLISRTFEETPELTQANSSYDDIQSSYPIDLDNIGNTLEATRLGNMIESLNNKSHDRPVLN